MSENEFSNYVLNLVKSNYDKLYYKPNEKIEIQEFDDQIDISFETGLLNTNVSKKRTFSIFISIILYITLFISGLYIEVKYLPEAFKVKNKTRSSRNSGEMPVVAVALAFAYYGLRKLYLKMKKVKVILSFRSKYLEYRELISKFSYLNVLKVTTIDNISYDSKKKYMILSDFDNVIVIPNISKQFFEDIKFDLEIAISKNVKKLT